MNVRQFISVYRWPMIIVGLLAMSIVAQGVLVFVATRPDSPPPIDNYYQRAEAWDADAAVLAASRQLGWRVEIEIPRGEQYSYTARRPVDVAVVDRAGEPVSGLAGQLIAQRPADESRNGSSELFELPHQRGHYRALAGLSVSGLWHLSVDARLGEVRFVHRQRVQVPEEAAQ